jgi:arylsulfatase A-like enzyme
MYEGEVNYIDSQLGRLFTHLRNRGLLDRTIIVIFADHGEEFLEHGLHGHGLTLYDEVIRVPLIIRYPLMLPSDKVIKGQVQLLDVFPTILSLAGIRNTYHMEGRDLLPIMYSDGKTDSNRFAFMETGMSGDMRYGIRSSDLKYLTGFKLKITRKLQIMKGEEGYQLAADSAEQHDLCSQDPTLCAMLRDKLNKYKEVLEGESAARGVKLGASRELSIEERERLRSLGYLH